MLIKYLKVGAVFFIVSVCAISVINAANNKKDKMDNAPEGDGPATPIVTWNGKDLTVESSEMIDRVVVSGERHEVADTVAVIALDTNRGIVDITVETESGDYDCEIDTDAEDSTSNEQE